MAAAPGKCAIARVELKGLGAQGFSRWLDQWQELRRAGWDVTVLVAGDRTHAIGLAWRPLGRAGLNG